LTGFFSWGGAAGAVVIALAACSHEEPFQNQNPGLDSTIGQGPDRQLTLNPGADLRPAWLSDGSGLICTYEGISGTVHDRCLAILPPSGGTRRDLPCAESQLSQDSVDVFSEAAPGPGDKLLFTREWSLPGDINPVRGALEKILASHEPYPAVVVNRWWELIDANSGIAQIAQLKPGEKLRVSEPVFACLEIAQKMELATRGAFSVTAAGGAEGVGRAVNQAVVIAIMGVFSFNYVFTQTLLATHPDLSQIK